MFRRGIFWIFLLTYSPLFAADINGDGFDTILLPLAFSSTAADVPGAYGTAWSGDAWIHNGSTRDVRLYECSTPCFPHRYAPDDFNRVGFPLGAHPQLGYMLYVDAQAAPHVTFSNRIFERTLRGQPRGVDVPAVREGNFFASQRAFLGVPVDEGVRAGLRVYDPWVHQHDALTARAAFPPPSPPLEGVSVEVRDQNARVLTTTILRPVVTYRENVADISRPGLAAIYDLAAALPQLRDAQTVHIRVTPIPNGAQYYAMVSITDNQTQTVSIITAQ